MNNNETIFSRRLGAEPQTETKLINLTSETATQPYNSTYLSNVSFDTPSLLVKSPYISKVELELLHAEIPVSFYTINYSNSYFKYQIDTDPVTTQQVPVGNYNANSLITALLTLINDANFQITISKITGKLTFHHNKTFIIYTDNQYSIGEILGFTLGTSYSSIELPNYTLNAPYPLNLLGIKKININSSRLITNNFTSGQGSNTLLHSLSVDQPSWGLVIYENTSGIRFNLGNREIHKIDLQLFDEDQNYINFNNINWSMLFCLHITYDYSIGVPSFSAMLNGDPLREAPIYGIQNFTKEQNPSIQLQNDSSPSPSVDWKRNPQDKLEKILTELSLLSKQN